MQNYFIQEVQRVYRLQGVDINDKHIEVIVRQMMHKVKIEDSGDTGLLTGSLINMYDLEKINEKTVAEGKETGRVFDNPDGNYQGRARDGIVPLRGVVSRRRRECSPTRL